MRLTSLPALPALRRWAPLLAVGGLLGAAAVAAALSSPEVTRLPLPRPRHSPVVPSGAAGNPEMSRGPGAESSQLILPPWLAELALGLCLLVVVVIVGLVVWVVLRDTFTVRKGVLRTEDGTPTGLRPRTEEVVAALDAGLSDLSDTDRDPRRAVIACWVRLEQAAASAGTPRHLGDTPADLVLRLLGGHRVDRGVLDRFAGLYREARYATHVIDDEMRAQAQSALRQLRGELTDRVVAP